MDSQSEALPDAGGIGTAAGAGLQPAAAAPAGPAAATAADADTRHCLNCGAELSGPYCSACGQKRNVHRSLGAFWHDFTHSIFHFEGKIWRTLPLLAFKPGELTRRYAHGERARFVSPLALFLFSVFLMFASFNQFGVPIGPSAETMRNGKLVDRAEMAREMDGIRARITALEAKRAAAMRAAKPTGAIDEEIASAREDLAGLQIGYDFSDGIDARDLIKLEAGERPGDKDFGNTPPWFRTFLARLDGALKNPSLLMYKVQSSAYKFSWLLIPLSLPFLWLLFAWRRQFLVYDHLVFITYSLSFVTLLLALTALVGAAARLEPVVPALLLFVPPLHMLLQLKGAYQLTVGSALWRTIAMQIAALLVLILFSLILLALGVAG